MPSRPFLLFVSALVALASVVGWSGRAAAGPPSSLPTLTVEPVFGGDTPVDSGWTEVLARVENPMPAELDGIVELSSSDYVEKERTSVSAAVRVPAGGTAYVRLPLLPVRGAPRAVLRSSDGTSLAMDQVRLGRERTPFLVLVEDGASLGAALRSYVVPTFDNGRNNLSTLALGTTSTDRTTGEPILPEHAAAYATVSVLLMRSDRLARVHGAELEALRDWVSGGGSLAVVVARPEDLRHPNLVSLVGGEAHGAPAPLKRFTSLAAAVKTNGAFDDADEQPSTSPSKERVLGAVPYPLTLAQRRQWKTDATPPRAVVSALVGFSGGALEESDFGATARHGLGEVHLLGFDPSAPAMLDDPWVHGRIVEMVARAWDRRAQVVFPIGGAERGDSTSIRRLLDPNESFRPGLAVAALLLLVYSVVAGPVLFRIMRKRQKPLLLLQWLPALSAVAFFGIVGIGLMTKGVRGRARQLTLLEAGGGDARASARRFRGFYGSGASALAVRGSEPGSLLSSGHADDDWGRQEGILHVGGGGVVLDDIGSAPWQTVVVREDAAASLGSGGVSIVPVAGGVELVNGTAYELRDVIVHVPGRPSSAVYFASIASGARVRSDAAPVRLPESYVSRTSSERSVGGFSSYTLRGPLAARDAERINDVWDAFTSSAGGQVDVFPEDEPVVLAELSGYPTAAQDSGVKLESNRTLVRIVGFTGGAR